MHVREAIGQLLMAPDHICGNHLRRPARRLLLNDVIILYWSTKLAVWVLALDTSILHRKIKLWLTKMFHSTRHARKSSSVKLIVYCSSSIQMPEKSYEAFVS
jgi:hypothetical protein